MILDVATLRPASSNIANRFTLVTELDVTIVRSRPEGAGKSRVDQSQRPGAASIDALPAVAGTGRWPTG